MADVCGSQGQCIRHWRVMDLSASAAGQCQNVATQIIHAVHRVMILPLAYLGMALC